MAQRDTLLFARLSRNGVTNELLRAQTVSTNFVERIAEFRITEAGDYDLELRDEDGVNGSHTIIDGVSLRMIEEGLSFEPPFAESTVLSVAQGARLHLGFEGTNLVQRLRFGGRVVSGVVSAKTHPEFLSGPGCLESPRRGMVILVR